MLPGGVRTQLMHNLAEINSHKEATEVYYCKKYIFVKAID